MKLAYAILALQRRSGGSRSSAVEGNLVEEMHRATPGYSTLPKAIVEGPPLALRPSVTPLISVFDARATLFR